MFDSFRFGRWRPRCQLTEAEVRSAAKTALKLFLTSAEWTHRRVETIEVIDERIVRRKLSVDFTVPVESPVAMSQRGFRGGGVRPKATADDELAFVPITWLRRYKREPRLPAGRMHIDLTDEHGCSLPLLGAKELDEVTASMLYQLATQHLADSDLTPDSAILHALTHVAVAFPPETKMLRALLDESSDDWNDFAGDPGGRRRRVLKRDRSFVELLRLAAQHRLVLVPVVVKPGQRRIVKLAYDEPCQLEVVELPGRARLREWFTLHTGWWPRFVVVAMPVVGAAKYQHVQVVSPPNVELTGVRLTATRPSAPDPELFPESDYDVAVDGPANRAHLYIDQALDHQVGMLELGFRAERRGMVTASLAAATLIVMMLLAFAIWPERLVTRTSGAASLLLIGPGLVAAFLIRGGEHAMARLLFRFPRALLAMAAIVVAAAAVVVVALAPATSQMWITTTGGERLLITQSADPSSGLRIVLWLLAGVSLVLWLGMVLSWVFPRPRSHPEGGARPPGAQRRDGRRRRLSSRRV
jgi:hypothetical protein